MFTINNQSKSENRLFYFNGAYVARGKQKILAIDEGHSAAILKKPRVTSSCTLLKCEFLHFPISTLKNIELGDRIITHTTDWLTDDGIRTELVCTSTNPTEFATHSQRRDKCANVLVDFDKDYRPMDIESGQIVEITKLVERLELIEEKLGVRFDGILARARKRLENSPPDYILEVLFDVVALFGDIKNSFHPTVSVYNDDGQLVGLGNTIIISTSFVGIESCRVVVECAGKPVRLRLHPSGVV